MATVETSDGATLYAERHGEGIPLVLSCGFCTTHENWRGQVAPLAAAGARVVLWDLRGHGRSDVPSEPSAYSVDQVVDDLGRVLDWAAPGEPVVLGGHSFGGLASLHFAARFPERVRGLVLLATGPGFKKPEAAQRWAEQVERTASILEERGLEEFLAGRGGDTCVGTRRDLEVARRAADAIAQQDVRGLALFGRHASGLAPSVIDELAGIACPALILAGEHDKAFGRAAEVMAAKLPNAEHVILEGAGHVANIEDAERFNAEVVRFLERLAG
jgi:pimeloyl-ACP methyl ester carboxylesterase